ncbi:MAG: O-methyltransferase [Chitinophagales bacterium]
MDFIPKQLANYAEQHTSQESDVLYGLYRDTHIKTIMPQMIAGHLQGAFLSMMSFMIQPKQILEVGTFTGYSAICLCAGLQKSGMLHTIDINEELQSMQQQYFEKAGVTEKIKPYIGNALDIIPKIEATFDLVFLDADKINYANYYDMVFEKVRKGGYIIADNVLWSGKVLDQQKDKDTAALDAYNKKIQNDNRVQNILLPIRDGIMIARKMV